MLDVDTLMAAIMGAEGQHSRVSGRDLPLKTAVLHKRRCSTRMRSVRNASCAMFFMLPLVPEARFAMRARIALVDNI